MSEKFFEWLQGIMVRPVETLRDIAREKPVGLALLVYLGVSILNVLVSIYSDPSMADLDEIMYQIGLHIPQLNIIAVLVFVAITVISVFVITGLVQLFARLFRGQGGYWELFSAYCFAGFPMIIGIPVSIIGYYLGFIGALLSALVSFGLAIWVIVLQVIAIRESHSLSTGASIGAYILSLVVLFVVFFIIGIVAVIAVLGPVM